MRRRFSSVYGISGREIETDDAIGSPARSLASRPHRARDPRHGARRPAYSRKDRTSRLRRVPSPARAESIRLAASVIESGMTPDEYCQPKAAASGSSFYYSFLFLPPGRRRAITALYAFCREVDDVVDETSEMQVAAAKLAWWRVEVAN